jgi:hypothetical protein
MIIQKVLRQSISRLLCVTLIIAHILHPATVNANVGPPWSGGQVVAEPIGVIDIAINHEELTIDLRPLANNNRAQVQAIYQLQNDGDAKTLQLLFASGSSNDDNFQIWLDDQAIESAPLDDFQLPESWNPPEKTPGLHGGTEIEYVAGRHKAIKPVAFTVTIPSGQHQLKVTYAAEAVTYRSATPTVYRQFAYVLAPARAWSSLGGLDVTIHVPENWDVATTPNLTGDGNTLVGHFGSIPADAIAITLQAPVGQLYQPISYISLGLFWLVLVGGILLCLRVGYSRGKQVTNAPTPQQAPLYRPAAPLALLAGFLWAVLVLSCGLFATFGPQFAIPDGQASNYGYGKIFAAFGVIILSAIAFVLGFLIVQFTAIITRSTQLNKLKP